VNDIPRGPRPRRPTAPLRDRLPFGQQVGRELLAQRRWGRRGRETRHRHLLRGLAAWRLCLSCLSL